MFLKLRTLILDILGSYETTEFHHIRGNQTDYRDTNLRLGRDAGVGRMPNYFLYRTKRAAQVEGPDQLP
jgi:hypothetical protein